MHIEKNVLAQQRDACPVCKSADRDILFSQQHNSPGFIDFIRLEPYFSPAFYEAYENGPANSLTYEIAACKQCGFLYLTEVLNDQGMGLLYNDWLDKDLLRNHYSKIPYDHYHDQLLGIVRKHLRKKAQPVLMDFGAGYGNFVAISVKKGFKTYAFDLSTDKNEFMDSMGVQIINDLSGYKNYFDFIWVNQVFEHVADPLGILTALKESLANDGLMYVAVPDCTHLQQIIREKPLSHDMFRLLSPHQHINAFTNSTLQLLGRNSGLVPLGVTDFLKLFNLKLTPAELILLLKKTIRHSRASTGLFFKKPPTTRKS